jgi:hypothetical protein
MHDYTDGPVLRRIEELMSQQHRLHDQEALSNDDLDRLRGVRMELDQSWDLLRQRRALRAAGQDPDKAQLRPPKTVQKYVQ